eukprot:3932492-Rhodomonas_salina.3
MSEQQPGTTAAPDSDDGGAALPANFGVIVAAVGGGIVLLACIAYHFMRWRLKSMFDNKTATTEEAPATQDVDVEAGPKEEAAGALGIVADEAVVKKEYQTEDGEEEKKQVERIHVSSHEQREFDDQ